MYRHSLTSVFPLIRSTQRIWYAPKYSTFSRLYLAFQLSEKKWKLGLVVRLGQEPCKRTIEAKDLVAVGKAIQLARKQIKLPEEY